MSETIAIFVPDSEMIPADELLELTGIENVIGKTTPDGDIVQYRIAWDDVTLLIETPINSDDNTLRVNEFMNAVDKLLGKRTDKKAKKIWRRVERMVKVLYVTVADDWDDAQKAQKLVQGMMDYYDYAFLWANGTLYNENGNIEVGHDNSQRKYWYREEETKQESQAARKRKNRSLKQIKHEKIPVIEHLPTLPDDDTITVRPVEEIARRAIALSLISNRADGKSHQWYMAQVEQYGIREEITPEELTFAEDSDPDEYMAIRFSQRMESCWTLLWVLGYIGKLAKPVAVCDAVRANEIISTRTTDDLIKNARRQNRSDILDATDLHFRYHWATVDAELYGNQPPQGLVPPVVYERHYALNWVIDLHGQEWDWVTTDT